MADENAIKRGYAAKALLENADFIIALDAVRLDAFRGWAGTSPHEGTKREEHYYLLQAIDRLKSNLEALASNARFEEHKAQQEAEKPNNL